MTPLEARHWLNLSIADTIGTTTHTPVRPDLLPVDVLRDYQYAILVEVARLMRLGYRRILIVLPTGGGKTVMASAMIGSALQQRDPAQFVVHRKELIDQTSDTFAAQGLAHGFVASGRPAAGPGDLATLAGVQTLVRRLELLLPPRLAIVDEAHHATATSWSEVLAHYAAHDAFVVGLTATPQRLDGKGLDDHFDVMVLGPTTAELIDAGYLSPFRYFAPGVPDLSGVHTTAGDFNRAEIDDVMNEPKIIGDVVEHYRRLALGHQGIVFGASIEHSMNLAEAFAANGVPAVHVDGSMGDTERRAAVNAFKAGDMRIMTNVDLFGEGFDVPAVVYVGMARPTKSLALHRQQCGRGLRLFHGKSEAILCDHAGNAFRHGLPDDEPEWSLQGRAERPRGTGTPADSDPVHQCLVCYRVVPSSVTVCPGCDTEFPVQKREVKLSPGELAELKRIEREQRAEEKRIEREAVEQEKRNAQIKRKIEERQCQTYADFRELAIKRGYQHPHQWAKRQRELRSKGRITAA